VIELLVPRVATVTFQAMLSFHAVCARAMTHAGNTPSLIDETEYLMREFLSCVRGLDVRVRYDVLGGGPKSEAFWLKPNFMSFLNLVDMMISLGLLIPWWDGGGKSEKFIQEIRPHILRSVREDYFEFFRLLARKIYKVRQIKYIEERLVYRYWQIMNWRMMKPSFLLAIW
jgi:hypothetical protein